MHLYIANGTRQVQDFQYRLPEIKQVRRQMIPVGGQIKISGDLTQADVDAVIAQHVVYGLIPVDEVDSGRGNKPLCYQVGRVITPERIAMLMKRNEGVMVERGRETRKNAAIGMASILGASARDQGTGATLEEVEVTAMEDTRNVAADDRAGDSIVVNREDRPRVDRPRLQPRNKGRS